MCGIAGIFCYRGESPVDRGELIAVRDYMARRGPDGAGEWYSKDNRIGLAHRRLSIIDLSDAGAQPMTSADGSLVCVFNGEIYNYKALRKELEQKGCRFQSHTDTEVLLHLYSEHGPGMVDRLRGMFAFAIWDGCKKGLFLARDPYGIKPVYYSNDGKTFRFASQVKALLAGGKVDTSPDSAGHVGYFIWGHIPAPHTLYKGIGTLTAGCRLWVGANGVQEPETYCSVTGIMAEACSSQPPALNPQQRQEHLRDALVDSVRHHLIADVPVGVFLSAGMDSTTLAALTAEQGGELRTVTLGFEEFKATENDETILAEKVARQLGAKHQTIWVTREDFAANRERLLKAMDQPSIDGVNSFFVSQAAAEAGLKCVLSGVGGDELFGSYPSFRQIPQLVERTKCLRPLSVLGPAVRSLSLPLLSRVTSPKYAGLLEYGCTYGGAYLLRRAMFMPWELGTVMDPEMAREGWANLALMHRLEQTTKPINSPFVRVAALESTWYMRHQLLRDTDWASMDHSLEIRTPFVDIDLLRRIAPLQAQAAPLKKCEMARTPAKPLPPEILNKPKTGFTVPVRDWIQGENSSTGERGLRGWAKAVYRSHCPS